MQIGFEHRSHWTDDEIRMGMVDIENGDKWADLGSSTAWCWQQGCMLQWVPGTDSKVIWNDREDGAYVSRVLNVDSGAMNTIPFPIYAMGPDGSWAVSTDFRRLNDARPGYGSVGIADPNSDVLALEDVGIWKVDLATGEHDLLISVAQAAEIPKPRNEAGGMKHYFTHLLVSLDGSRLIFLHRWRNSDSRGSFRTRVFPIGSDGSVYISDPHGKTSHFIWRDPGHVLAWAWHPSHEESFYLFRVQTEEAEVVAPDVMPLNGHCTHVPGNKWILNDTYPDEDRLQHRYPYEVARDRRIPLGHFLSPPEYTGERRCDTHPRFSPDGKKLVIASPMGVRGGSFTSSTSRGSWKRRSRGSRGASRQRVRLGVIGCLPDRETPPIRARPCRPPSCGRPGVSGLHRSYPSFEQPC